MKEECHDQMSVISAMGQETSIYTNSMPEITKVESRAVIVLPQPPLHTYIVLPIESLE